MAFGPETNDWVGGKVTLFKVPTKYNDEPKDGVRIKVDPANYLPLEKRTPPTPAPAAESAGQEYGRRNSILKKRAQRQRDHGPAATLTSPHLLSSHQQREASCTRS